MYDIPDYQRTDARGRYTYFTGERIDRILAGPGDGVLWQDGRLTVNGRPSDVRPLNPGSAPKRLEVTLPADGFLILPTTTPLLSPGDVEATWHSLSVVPADRVRGRVYAITNPLKRLRTIR
jgi:hypothetical protein